MNKITTERLMKSKIMVVSKKNADKIRKAMYEKWMHTENSVRYKA